MGGNAFVTGLTRPPCFLHQYPELYLLPGVVHPCCLDPKNIDTRGLTTGSSYR